MAKPKQENKKPNTIQSKPQKQNNLRIFFLFWGIVLVIVVIAVAAFKLNPIAILVWFIVMALSFILMMAQLLQQWEGTVEDIKVIAETRSDGDGDYTKENVTYAFVRLTNGKLKKMRSGGWKKGDHLKKEKWEYAVRVL